MAGKKKEEAVEEAAEVGLPEVGNYVLRKGMKHSYIMNGEIIQVRGDGKGTIPLSPEQVANFADKLVSAEPLSEAVECPLADAEAGVTYVEGVEVEAPAEEAGEDGGEEIPEDPVT